MAAAEQEVIADMIVEKPVIQQFIDSITPLADECLLNFSDEGFIVNVVDPANVASIIPAKINASGFESVNVPGSGTQGIDIKRLDNYLKKAKSDDLIRLRLDMETRRLFIDYREIHFKMGLIDPNSVRHEPEIPELELPNTVTVLGSALSEAVSVLDLLTDHVAIGIGDDGESVVLQGEGDIDDGEYLLDGDALIESDITDRDSRTLLSMDYMKSLTKPIPNDAEVRIEFGNEYPVRLGWGSDEGSIEVSQMLAPRIQSD